jgi:hypothetical protein
MNASRSSLFSALLLVSACSTVNYESPQFAERAVHHQVIAVLPFEMVLDGDPPKNLTAAQIISIEEAESVAFQEAYYYRLLGQSSAHRKHPIRVRIQHVEETNRLLVEKGIGVRESWGMSAKSLAQALRVDAVIRTSVRKTRYLSGGESFAIDTGLHVFNEISEGRFAGILPWGLTTTHDIWANSVLVDSLDGAVMWQSDLSAATDWRAPANDIIAVFTLELAKQFPYRG